MKVKEIAFRIKEILTKGSWTSPNSDARGFLKVQTLDAKVVRAMKRQSRKIGNKRDLPIKYCVYVSPKDYASYYGPRAEKVCGHLKDVVVSRAQENDDILAANPTFSIAASSDLTTGRCRVEACFAPKPDELEQASKMPHIGPTPVMPRFDSASVTPRMRRRTEAQLAIGNRFYKVSPTDTIGVVRRSGAHDALPSIALSLRENAYCSQLHGRFDYLEKGTWAFTCLSSNGTFLLKRDGEKKKLRKGQEESLEDGYILEIPNGQKLVFCEVEVV